MTLQAKVPHSRLRQNHTGFGLGLDLALEVRGLVPAVALEFTIWLNLPPA